MSLAEVTLRVGHQGRQLAWRRLQVGPGRTTPPVEAHRQRRFATPLRPGTEIAVPAEARRALLEDADAVLLGRWAILGSVREDLAAPDWFLDPVTGRRAPHDVYAFSINYRDHEEIGDVKQIWELSRHHHLTVLATAWYLTRDDRYAEAVAAALRSWWAENPFLSGIHWTSGIELGIRLIGWTWIRRLLDDWSGIEELFERNDLAVGQIRGHQRYLAAFHSVGSSANNHLVAETAGQLVAACAFPWFRESGRWRSAARARFERALEDNTFPSGLNREQASEYHCLTTELGLIAAVEAQAAGHPVGRATWARLCRSVDAAAAVADEGLRGPRQGDGDDGRALLIDRPDANHWPSLLALGRSIFGALPWWSPEPRQDVRSALVGALASGVVPTGERPPCRPCHFADAGLTILRTVRSEQPEIWCRCDAGPHGFLAIAAHAHADALSVEVRHASVDVLADPGTYCYHSHAKWRRYFRSTIGHNTLELGGADQSRAEGPFLWLDHASATLGRVDLGAAEASASLSAEHDGYRRLDPPAVHSRSVRLDRENRSLHITDRVLGGTHPCRLAFHLGPTVGARLSDCRATLTWRHGDNAVTATLSLPTSLRWTAHRGQTDPIFGWYSSAFGRLEPSITLVGTGIAGEGADLVTVLQFSPPAPPGTAAPMA